MFHRPLHVSTKQENSIFSIPSVFGRKKVPVEYNYSVLPNQSIESVLFFPRLSGVPSVLRSRFFLMK